MHQHRHAMQVKRPFTLLFLFVALLLLLAACGGTATQGGSSAPKLAAKQVLTFPNVGTTDPNQLDPAQGPDSNSGVVVSMIYSGLVRSDKNLNVIPDQATWDISSDGKVYTFHLKHNITFADGTPVTAQSYIYTWTRALLPAITSPIASFFEAPIVGADALSNGKAKTLTGVKAIDNYTLQVTLTQQTPYFLEDLTTSLFDPLNQNVVNQLGKNWSQNIAGNVGSGIGTGPFIVKEWDHNVKMILVPNPNYYGNKTKLSEVDMYFVSDPSTAYKSYRANQYNFVWNITATDQQLAASLPGFTRVSLLQTDLLFFDNTKAPFNNPAVRQAFAYATDRNTLVKAVFKNTALAAPTIIPPGMPGYQPNYVGLPYNQAKAKALLQSAYPDISKVPPISFSFPSSQVTPDEAAVLQQMWQNALGIQVKLRSVELNAYNQETANHQIQFGFTQWGADFPDPYDWLALNLTSTAPNNNGQWSNATFDQTIAQAETMTGSARLALYNKAEQIAITDVGWLPLDHQAMAAIIPSYLQGISLNGGGLYFGDWSNVSLLQH